MALRKPVVIASGEPQNLQVGDTLHVKSVLDANEAIRLDATTGTNFFAMSLLTIGPYFTCEIAFGLGLGFCFNGDVVLLLDDVEYDEGTWAGSQKAASRGGVADAFQRQRDSFIASINARTGSGVKATSDATVASAATVDLTAVPGPQIDITGTTPITTIIIPEGEDRVLRFTGSLNLTHSASLLLPNGELITTEAGDFGVFRGEAGVVTRVARFIAEGGGNIYFGGDVSIGADFTTNGNFSTSSSFSTGGAFSTSGTFSTGDTFSTSGGFETTGGAFILRTVAGSDVNFPASGTLTTLAGSETLTNKTINASQLVDGSVTLAKLANMATASFLGRNTAATGVPEVLSVATAKTMLGLTGTNSGDQTITLTGDVTGGGTGSFTATIASSAVTLAKMANLAGLSIIGRSANTTGVTAAITGVDGDVLRVSGTTLGFGSIVGAGIGAGAISTGKLVDAAVTLAKMANMATASFLGRNTAATGVPEVLSVATAKTMLGLTGTNSGDQTITLTGDVTGTGTGSFTTTIAAGAVTLAKMANIATASFLGRNTAATGVPEVLSIATAKTMLGFGYALSVYAAGTPSDIVVTTPTALDFGTTDPVLTIDQAGTYLIFARVMVKVQGDLGADYTTTFKLRRTNNTAADVANSVTDRSDNSLAIAGYASAAGYCIPLPPVVYTTALTNDSITIFGSADANIVGSAFVTEASIVAVRIY